jgi:hypothetical protein
VLALIMLMHSVLSHFTRLRRKPRLPVLRSSLLRRMDQAVEKCTAGVLRPVGKAYGRRAEALAKEDMLRRVSPNIFEGPRL